MMQKLSGIVLSVFRYNDTKNIVHIYTEQRGRLSFLVSVSRSKRSAVSSLLFKPLSLVEFEADMKPNSSLHTIKESRLWYSFSSLPYNPYKSGIALFVAEFLFRVLKEEGRNEALYAYVVNSVMWLDGCERSFANFHLVFLIRLSRFLGLYPNTENYIEGSYFDLLNACFTIERPVNGMYVCPEEASKIVSLMRMKYETMHLFSMSRNERNRCLEIIKDYYSLHVPEFGELKSLEVLKELYS